VPVVRGLVSEGDRVRRTIEEVAPGAVALTLGKEDLESLLRYDGTEAEPANWEEELYVAGLSAFGTVRKPPPCYVEAVRGAQERGIPVRALDLNDEDYTEAYIEYVTAWDLLGHTRVQKKAEKHVFAATTPEEFVVEFDGFVNDPDGYVRLEHAREDHISRRLSKLARRYESLLAVVEYERAAGVRERANTLNRKERAPPGYSQKTN